ncbi:MAG: transporter [Verrucomicrobium sp.]|nr:transporter [Verrucomicrobium sp.]
MKPYRQHFIVPALAILSLGINCLRAEEGGGGQYLMGAFSSALDFTPTKPGFAIATDVLGYSGDFNGGRALPLGGVARTGLSAEFMAWDIAMAYTFEPKVLGASYSVGVCVPFLWLEVEADASITGPRGRTIARRVSDDAAGLTDMGIVPVSLTWKSGNWQFNFQEAIFAPAGDYEPGRLANLGRNIWSFDSVFGVSYLDPKKGLELTLMSGFLFSTENEDTDYQNGNIIHTEATVAQYLPLGKSTILSLGVNGFYYQQVSGDSGAGASLGDLKGRAAGVGPIVNLIQTIGDKTLAIQAKWLPELDTKNRLEGDWVWLTIGMTF